MIEVSNEYNVPQFEGHDIIFRAEASDVILIHGNGCSRQDLYKLIKKAQSYAPDKPILINEDSQAIGVSLMEKTSSTQKVWPCWSLGKIHPYLKHNSFTFKA